MFHVDTFILGCIEGKNYDNYSNNINKFYIYENIVENQQKLKDFFPTSIIYKWLPPTFCVFVLLECKTYKVPVIHTHTNTHSFTYLVIVVTKVGL